VFQSIALFDISSSAPQDHGGRAETSWDHMACMGADTASSAKKTTIVATRSCKHLARVLWPCNLLSVLVVGVQHGAGGRFKSSLETPTQALPADHDSPRLPIFPLIALNLSSSSLLPASASACSLLASSFFLPSNCALASLANCVTVPP